MVKNLKYYGIGDLTLKIRNWVGLVTGTTDIILIGLFCRNVISQSTNQHRKSLLIISPHVR